MSRTVEIIRSVFITINNLVIPSLKILNQINNSNMIFKLKGKNNQKETKELISDCKPKEISSYIKDKQLNDYSAKISTIKQEQLIEEEKDLAQIEYDLFSLNEDENNKIIPINPNDDDYEPPQWFKQQQKKNKSLKSLNESNQNTDIIISEEFTKESQIEESRFQIYYSLIPNLKYLDKEILSEHFRNHINFTARIVDFPKGKTRGKKLDCDNIQEFIDNEIMPNWNQYIKKISKKKRETYILQKGPFYIWIEFLKDIRKFYRLIFRLRFHRSDKRNNRLQTTVVKTLCEELGVRLNENQSFGHLHHFFYNAQYKMRKGEENVNNSYMLKDTPFEVFYEFSHFNFEKFIVDEVGSQLIYFFVKNYSNSYLKCMRKTFSKAEKEIKSVTLFIDKIKE